MATSSSEAAATATTSRTATGGSALPGPPPPTPSNHHAAPPSAAAGGGTDASLSAFLHRLLLSSPAPQLRSPLAARSQASPSLPPLVSLECPDQRALRDAADAGYFHLAGHGLPSELPSSALAELSRIGASMRLDSNLRTLGFSDEEEGEEQDLDGGGADDPAVVFDACEGDMDALPAAAEYARRMRDLGMRVVALLSGCPDTGLREEPFADGRRKPRCLVWASRVSTADTAAPPAVGKAKAYPYVLALHCQWEASGQEDAPPSWVMNDGGEWTAVGARDGAILVTIGDIAQVWSNGKLKKARGMARPISAPVETQHGETDRLSLTVLITLSLDNVISPLVPLSNAAGEGGEDEANGAGADDEDGWTFHSFLLEDYAWRVYNQRLQFKDPLLRCSVTCFKKHKEESCQKTLPREEISKSPLQEEATLNTTCTAKSPNTVCPTKALEVEDPSWLVDNNILRSLAELKGIHDALRDPELQKMILKIDGSPEPEKELEKVMEGQAFRQFADEILDIVSPKE